jgi:delta-1-pyrroline-5-carboxylate synthetase
LTSLLKFYDLPKDINDESILFSQLFTTINELLQLNIIPIINTNDAVSPPQQKDLESAAGLLNITDNDSLAARISVEAGADLAILVCSKSLPVLQIENLLVI